MENKYLNIVRPSENMFKSIREEKTEDESRIESVNTHSVNPSTLKRPMLRVNNSVKSIASNSIQVSEKGTEGYQPAKFKVNGLGLKKPSPIKIERSVSIDKVNKTPRSGMYMQRNQGLDSTKSKESKKSVFSKQ